MTGTHTVQTEKAFVIQTANESTRAEKNEPAPKMLFGELWLEGELAIMFGGTGTGKSVLATQIAESIARGRAIEPMKMDARPQKVLYLDFKLTAKQREMRYTEDPDPDTSGPLRKHYSFSDRFNRISVGLNAPAAKDRASRDAWLYENIEEAVRETGAKVLIIDNVTCMQRTSESMSETLGLMHEMNRLKWVYGLSILVLAQTSKRTTSSAMAAGHLEGSKILSNLGDNMFAIGQSRQDAGSRYIKHIKSRSTPIYFDGAHLPTFRITKIGGNFLGFEYRRFAAEAEHLQGARDRGEWETINRIKKMSDDGMAIRSIADELAMSKTTVHRLLQIGKEFHVSGSMSQGFGSPPSQNDLRERVGSHGSFPGCEEYDEAMSDPRFADAFAREDEAGHLLRREFAMIDTAKANARLEFERTGKAPSLDDDPRYSKFVKWLADNALDGDTSGSILAQFDSLYDSGSDLSDPPEDEAPTLRSLLEKASENDVGPCTLIDPPLSELNAPLIRKLNEYDKEIFVESQDERGKSKVWYAYDSLGRLHRWTRNNLGIAGERIRLVEKSPE